MKKITKQNWKKIVRELIDKNAYVYTVRGKKIPAKEAKFKLEWDVKGHYDISATRK